MHSVLTTAPSHSSAGNKRHRMHPEQHSAPSTPHLSHLTKRCATPRSREDLWKVEPGQKTVKTWGNVNVKAFLVLCCILIPRFISLKKFPWNFALRFWQQLKKKTCEHLLRAEQALREVLSLRDLGRTEGTTIYLKMCQAPALPHDTCKGQPWKWFHRNCFTKYFYVQRTPFCPTIGINSCSPLGN